jgi:hypothetical protein
MDAAFLLGLVKDAVEEDGESMEVDGNGVTGVPATVGDVMDGRRANGVEGVPAVGLMTGAPRGELICGDSVAVVAAIDTRL